MNVCKIKCETKKKKSTKTKPGFSLCNITVVPKINLKLLCVSYSAYVAVLKKIKYYVCGINVYKTKLY